MNATGEERRNALMGKGWARRTVQGEVYDGCPSSEEDAPTGGANDGGQDESAEGLRGCGREQSQGDDGGNVVHNDIDKDNS